MDIGVLMSFCVLLIAVLFLLYKAYRRFEEMVCSEVCAIYCNTIVYIDQLCGVNNEILTSWHKFYLKNAMKGDLSFQAVKKMTDEILFRKKEIEQLKGNNVHLTFHPSGLKSAVLHKHKLNTQEVQAALAVVESNETELIDNFDYLLDFLNSETKISSNWIFAENRMKCFQHESNALFMGH